MQEQHLGLTPALLCQGCFMLAAFSWACILPVLLQIDLWQTASSCLFECQSFGGQDGPQRDANYFLVPARVLRDVVLFPPALKQLVLSPVSAKTCTVAI